MSSDENNRKFYVGNLHVDTTDEAFKEYFGRFGEVTDSIIMRDQQKQSRRYGFVTFSTNEAVEACLAGAPHQINETEVDVQRAMPKGQKAGKDAGKKVFVGGLNPETTDEGLKTYFDQFGEITDCIVMKHKDSSKSRCFGFVTFSSVEYVDAVQNARPHTIDGSSVETKRATSRDDKSGFDSSKSVKKIFVGGFKSRLEDSDIQEYFSQFGHVVSALQVLEKGSSKKLGFAFVEFDDYDAVDKAIIQGNHEINGAKVDIRKALGRDEMQAMKAYGGGGSGSGGGRRGGSSGGGNWGNQGGYGGGFGGYGQGQWGGSQGYGGWDQPQSFGGGSWGNQGGGAGNWGDSSGGWGGGSGSYMGNDNNWGGGFGGGNGGGGGIMRNQMPGKGNRPAPYNTGGRGGARGGGVGGRGGGANGAGRW